jgi:hypothetical protein
MFIVNLVMALTALPALAVVMERIWPRNRRARVPSIMIHAAEDAGVPTLKG